MGESYNEQILQSIINGTPYENPNPYPSRIEQLLMELKEVIEQGGGGAVDQTYTPTSENAQSGTAVAEALETIPSVTVDQTFDGTSANAQSGVAVQQAISSNKYTVQSPYTTGVVVSSVPHPNVYGYYATTTFCNFSVNRPQSIPEGNYIAYVGNNIIGATTSLNNIIFKGFITDVTSTQYNTGDQLAPGLSATITLIKI